MWRRDWFLGLVLALAFALAAGSELLQGLERKAYDLGVQASRHTPSDRVAVIAIDDRAIANIGRWPWPREIHARLIDLLTGAGAKVVGYTAFFTEPQTDPGLAYVRRLLQLYETRLAPAGAAPAPALAELGATLREAQEALDQDAKLAAAIRRSGRTVLAMAATLGEPAGRPDGPLPAYARRDLLAPPAAGAAADAPRPLPAREILLPLPAFGEGAAGIGHLNFNLDADGGARTLPLVLRHHDALFPALALTVVARYLNLRPQDLAVVPGRGVRAGGRLIPTDPALQMRPIFYAGQDGRPAFQVDGFYDVLSGRIPADKYRNRIVLVGATASGVGSTQVTPVSPAMAPVVTLAHMVSSLLQGDFVATPPWTGQAAWGALALVALYLILVLPRVGPAAAASLTFLLLAGLLGAEFYALVREALWIPLMVPAALLLSGHLLLVSKRYLTAERGRQAADASSAESNRMLGLAFQHQGQLDMAFEKFRKVPLDDAMMELLYNLGLDFERKRQFAKAAAVFEYAAGHDPRFRDLQERIKRNRQLGETVMLGAGGSGPQATLVLGQEGVQKPMLGRYQVEKELGKGAMGVVYQGRDPKINRVVAIKTLALSQEFEADELEEVKARFFREAETAGRLNHPHIVTIYDAGEEQDLAYIAMEFLQGENLTAHTRPDQLLPVDKVVDIVVRVGEALDYAHGHQVVHRDIKPANIMYEPQTDQVKVTDFGIARITDASRTKTGVILGTPSYMSPEQLIGRKVDGRSDIFSLGVMTFQLLAGRLPFQGDSLATLTYQIANEPAPDLLKLRPDLDPCIARVVARCLEKSVEARWQSAGEFVSALRACRQAPGAG